MLLSIKKLDEHPLSATDGEIGHVKDFYFDDRNWAVRYVVADTGTWLPGRKVLLSPHAFGRLRLAGKSLAVNLTRQQIEGSPSIETHKPVSRQFEEAYYRHYGWPFYWQGGSLWGMDAFPEPAQAEGLAATSPLFPTAPETHLRSAKAVNGYQLQAKDRLMGHVCDFLVDDRTWAIRHLVIRTGHRLSGQEVQIPTGSVNRISYEDSTVFVDLAGDAVLASLAPTPSLETTAM